MFVICLSLNYAKIQKSTKCNEMNNEWLPPYKEAVIDCIKLLKDM